MSKKPASDQQAHTRRHQERMRVLAEKQKIAREEAAKTGQAQANKKK